MQDAFKLVALISHFIGNVARTQEKYAHEKQAPFQKEFIYYTYRSNRNFHSLLTKQIEPFAYIKQFMKLKTLASRNKITVFQ